MNSNVNTFPSLPPVVAMYRQVAWCVSGRLTAPGKVACSCIVSGSGVSVSQLYTGSWQVIFLFPDYTNYLVTFSSVRLGWPTFATWGQNYGEIEGKLTELSCIILCMLLGATRCIHHFTGFVRSPASLLLNSYTRYMICDIWYYIYMPYIFRWSFIPT